ncbi:MAG: TIGR00159 family protein, partial [Oscillospiraceae bacterium]
MEQFKDAIMQTVHYLMLLSLPDIIDILIVAFIIYKLVGLIRKTNSHRVAKGIVIILFALWVSDWLRLTVIN